MPMMLPYKMQVANLQVLEFMKAAGDANDVAELKGRLPTRGCF